MKISTLLNNLVHESKFKKAEIARSLNVSPQAFQSRMKDGENPTVKSCVELLDVLGYQLVVTKKGAKLPSDAEIITLEDRGE